MATKTIAYGELKDGDKVYVQGYLFQASNVRIAMKAGERRTERDEPLRADVIRFCGKVVEHNNQHIALGRTSYNHGTYGGFADIQISIEVEP